MNDVASVVTSVSGSRADRLGSVHSVDRVVMSVPDLEEAKRFFEAFGLRCTLENAGARLDVGTYASPHVWMSVLHGARKKLLYVRYGAYAADYAVLNARLAAQGLLVGVSHERAAEVASIDGLWATDPDGLPVHIVVSPKSSPDCKSSHALAPVPPAGKGAAPSRSQAPRVRPRYLSHVLFFTRDVHKALGFYIDVLGLRLSDRSEGDIAFLHGAYGSDHHLVALVKSDGPGLHHMSWDVASVNEVGLGAEQMRSANYTRGWGIGRHGLGSNYFHYVRDPWGSYAEYSFDIDFVPADIEWPAANHPGEDSFYVWGPQPPADFAINFEMSNVAATSNA